MRKALCAAAIAALVLVPATAQARSCAAPTGLQAGAVSATDVHLSWQASIGCSGPTYQVFRDGSNYATVGTGLSWDDRNVQPASTHTYQVRAWTVTCGTNGYCYSSLSTSVTVTTPPAPDTQPPTAPTNLTATAGDGQVSLSWTASTDNVGVAHYTVYRSGTAVAASTATSYTDTGLTDGTSYTYYVTAVDAAGNQSQASVSVTATPLPPRALPEPRARIS